MDSLANFSILSLLIFTILYFVRSSSSYKKSKKLPPGPFPLPVIGNILNLGPSPHQSLAKLSKTYGPLMHLKLGSKHAVVASSPEIAKEILQKHDKVFSGRAVPHAAQAKDHDKASIAWLPADSKWRNYRKICKEYMFTVHKLEATEGIRQEKLKQLREFLHECCTVKRVVDIEEVVFTTSLNLMSATLLSVDFAHFDSAGNQEMKELIGSMSNNLGTPNLADFFPFLRLVDPQGLKRGNEVCFGKMFSIFDDIIRERLESRSESKDLGNKKDLLEVLLDLSQESDAEFSHNDMKNLILDLMFAGIDTTSVSVHWAMAELLRKPEKMWKLKDELRRVVGDQKQVQESDISRLPYLNAVIKETFRCHPAGPFLVPHKAEDDVEVNGYTIPKGAQVLVNVWAIGRDSDIWLDPDSFEPERFLGSKVDYRGQHFELITFGSGRRMCPGLPMAHVMVHLMVACLAHNFDWKLENETKPEDVDMRENSRLTLHKALPIKAIPIKKCESGDVYKLDI